MQVVELFTTLPGQLIAEKKGLLSTLGFTRVFQVGTSNECEEQVHNV